MARMPPLGILAMAAALTAGCAVGPDVANPLHVPAAAPELENPMFLPPGQTHQGYELVFHRIYDVVNQDFEIASSNRFAGRIETHWLTTAGYVDLPRLRLYSHYQNTEAMLQTVRRRAEIEIAEAEVGGYTVRVRVFKELEDLPHPMRTGAGAAVFRYESQPERQHEVVTETLPARGWIPYGRDHSFEQVLLAKIRKAI